MDKEIKKDALTELIDIVKPQPNKPSQKPNNGVVTSPSGDKVTLGFHLQIHQLAQKMIKNFRERKLLEQQIIKKQIEENERNKTK